MSGPSSESSPSFGETYKEIVIILNNGNHMLMQKCSSCGFMVRNNGFAKLSHWKRCPSKMKFRYVRQDDCSGHILICTFCGWKIVKPTGSELHKHHTSCKQTHSNPLDMGQLDVPPDDVQYMHENSVSQHEVKLYFKQHAGKGIVDPGPGYKIRYIHNGNIFERFSQCQICQKHFKRATTYSLTMHRRNCALPVLLSVDTQPFDPTISSSTVNYSTIVIDDGNDEDGGNEDEMNPFEAISTCFICNTRTSESYVSMYESVTTHSNAPIYDYVWNFLNDKPSVREDSSDVANSNWNLICMECYNKINQYDFACVTATRLEKELRDELALTEALYAPQQDIQNEYQTDDIGEDYAYDEEQIVDQNYETTSADATNPLQIEDNPNDIDVGDASAHCVIELSDAESDDEECDQQNNVQTLEHSNTQNDETIELSDDD